MQTMRKSSSQSSPKPTNTLLNYFNKSADNKTNGGSQTTSTNVVDGTPKPSSSQTSSTSDVLTNYKLYDLVWAKLEGYSFCKLFKPLICYAMCCI